MIRKFKEYFLEIILTIFSLLIFLGLINGFRLCFSTGPSMAHNINEIGDKELSIEIKTDSAFFGGLKRFDIVSADTHQGYYVGKRVIGLPNEKITFEYGSIYINGELLDDPYGSYFGEKKYDGVSATFILGPDEYFLMGDNRNNSLDSRYFGPFSIDDIISKRVFTIFQI